MKKYIVFLLLLIVSPLAVSVHAKSLSEQCEDITGVNTIDIDQSMLKLAVFPSNDSPIQLTPIADLLDKVQIISTKASTPARDRVMALTDKYLESAPKFKRAMRTKDDTTLLVLYSRALEKDMNEFLLIVEDKTDLTIVLLAGNITMEEIGSLTSF
ncbi:MAG: DUF4252 domain-containing protein [Bacteroidales bacterium]|nr:DUF4252 domain-containing protein [Bacteroidales bacterium]